MITSRAQPEAGSDGHPTVWGLTPVELHDRFWAARGVQVVRPGEESQIVEDAELFLLMAPRLLTIFRLRPLVDQLSWVSPDVLWVRIHHSRERPYRETALTDKQGRFIRFERLYGGADARLARVALTPNRKIAHLWQSAADMQSGWRLLRQSVPTARRGATSMEGRTYDRDSEHEVMQFVRRLIQTWTRPDATIDRVRKLSAGVWGDVDCQVASDTEYVGHAWVGAGRSLTDGTSVVGPAVLWDDAVDRPKVQTVRWEELEPTQVFTRPVKPATQSALYLRAKRCFDLLFAGAALLVLLPLLPLILLAIYLEDGRPLFFIHRRETVGGRPFPCLKFRSMYRNAAQIKARLGDRNEVDGPQFYTENDPRLTRVGRLLRRFHLDELPQLFNVLAGHMSIVGPRPSPHEENQYCPTWREARLSVLPGITGLWQVMRTRQKGLDFQEWIKYDIEYVENVSLRLDMWILYKTFSRMLFGR